MVDDITTMGNKQAFKKPLLENINTTNYLVDVNDKWDGNLKLTLNKLIIVLSVFK
jgi:hypothetical protein